MDTSVKINYHGHLIDEDTQLLIIVNVFSYTSGRLLPGADWTVGKSVIYRIKFTKKKKKKKRKKKKKKRKKKEKKEKKE